MSEVNHRANGVRQTKSWPHRGVLTRCCLPLAAIESRTAISSAPTGIAVRFCSIRAGVTDFGSTMQPLLTWYEIKSVAGDTLYFSANAPISGSPRSGEPARRYYCKKEILEWPYWLILGGNRLVKECPSPRTTF